VIAAVCEWVFVVKLEVMALRAAEAVRVSIAATAAIAGVHQSPHRCRDMPRRRAPVRLWRIAAGRLRLAEAPGLDPLQLLADRDVDDPREIAVGHGRAHESLQTLELVAQLDAGREANLVAARSQRLNPCGPVRRSQLESRAAGRNWT